MLKKILNLIFDRQAKEIAKDTLKDLFLVVTFMILIGLLILVLNALVVLI